ncbi:glycoside hydrolase family 5 protein [Patulibacter minatonensis]|uniref:glycoside hydrolase family 5 protein n=1 Tax=Patulibacter minatonensis TaxID=298163 RepID=UPI00047E8D91|nr:cellulase family glycosylhydrolase [Patulibacter minatonensis]
MRRARLVANRRAQRSPSRSPALRGAVTGGAAVPLALLAMSGCGGGDDPAPSAPGARTPTTGPAAPEGTGDRAAPDGTGDRPRPLTRADALRVADGPDGAKVLRTRDGRDVRLRGANVNALVDYAGVKRTVPVTAEDADQFRALGFSVVRLAVSWSRIAPAPGRFDGAYLRTIERTARRFADRGIYVLLDLHQDRFGAGLAAGADETDGAPAWAAVTGGASTAADTGDGHPYYRSAAARAAATAFFRDRRVAGAPLQEHYADALARLARVGWRLGPALAGIELYNEPIDPEHTDASGPDRFSRSRLQPFYRRLVARLRGPDGTGPGAGPYDGPIWFEPQATRTQTDRDAAAARFSGDDGLVYGPHVYTDVFGGTHDAGTPARIAASFRAAADEARTYGAALAPTELPGASGGRFETDRRATLDQLDALGVGGMVWVWKQDPSASYGWGVLNADGTQRDDSAIAADYGRARVVAAGPRVLRERWRDGTLTVTTTGAGVLDLWDGAAFAATAPVRGASPRLTVDGAAPDARTVRTSRATARLGSADAWAGGRRIRLTLPAGRHEVVLGR